MNTLAQLPTHDVSRTRAVLQRLRERIAQRRFPNQPPNLRGLTCQLGAVANNLDWNRHALRDDLMAMVLLVMQWLPYHDDVSCLRILAERARQEELLRAGKFKFTCASADVSNLLKLPVLVEEVGEVGKAICEEDADGLNVELTQVAAVCVAWIEALEGNV